MRWTASGDTYTAVVLGGILPTPRQAVLHRITESAWSLRLPGEYLDSLCALSAESAQAQAEVQLSRLGAKPAHQ